ncbi:MAG: type II toxin-antitoxin system VapC family toxin [Gammaproteobacteria bacterium]|nr:MAG: type II toxin-antitoxin system VapC family toxin [Gammaproteobacteria bacterium]
MFILDTNVVSELRKAKAGKANPGVTVWANDVPAVLMFMSVISLHELEHGVLLAERRDPAQGDVLRQWLDTSVVAAFADRFLPVDEHVARQAAALHVPDLAPFRDALIAATAQVHAMSVVTRNVRDFGRFAGLEVTNPWT